MSGYIGRYVVIDLSSGKHEIVSPGDDFYRKYLSGYGLGAAVITMRQKPGIDPLSPEAHLGFCSGLLTGTGVYFSGRFMAVGKSPLTGGWGDANSGGKLSAEIKKAGYDAVFFTGRAKHPVWVSVIDGDIRIHDAKRLWGRDTTATEEEIRKEMGDGKAQVASIGKAGERLSLISGIVTDGGRIAARSGLGAVMGSKKLKALAVRGKGGVPVADPEKMKAMNRKFLSGFRKVNPVDSLMLKGLNFFAKIIARTGVSVPSQPSTVKEIMRTYGTSGLTVYSGMTGDSPIKNWIGVGYREFPGSHRLSDKSVIAIQKRKYACQSCPMACGGIIEIKKGRYGGTLGHKPEYETLCSFGGLVLHDDLDTIVEINELCNREGIDTISAGGAVAFAIECFMNGIIDRKDTGGLDLDWGRSHEILKLTEMIINREGIGDVLADGVKRAAARLGRGSGEFAVHAGGQELPMHDSRLDAGMGIAYQCEPTPGRHTISSYLYAHLYRTTKRLPGVKRLIRAAPGRDGKKVALYTGTTILMQLINGSGVCEFGVMCSDLPLTDYLNAVTGWGLGRDEYMRIGERILSLRKAFNVREGLRPGDSLLHPRAAGIPPLSSGPLKGKSVDMDRLQAVFFSLMGWDPSTGGPTREKMAELEIAELFS